MGMDKTKRVARTTAVASAAASLLLALAAPAKAQIPGISGVDGGKREQVNAALRNAALAEETYFLDEFSYTTSVDALKEQGLTYARGVRMKIPFADEQGYCVQARHVDLNGWRHFDSSAGAPAKGRCPDA